MYRNYYKIATSFTFLFFMFYACMNEDDAIPSYDREASVQSNATQGKWGQIGPENPDNPFDSVGINYTVFVEDLWERDSLFTSVQLIISEVNLITAYPNPIALNNLTSAADLLLIQNTLEDPDEAFQDTLDQSWLSTNAKTSLLGIINYTTLHESDDYELLHPYIVNFENLIAEDLNLSNDEKTAILSFTSYIRHTLHLKKRRDDKDWDISVASKTGALKGALLNPDATTYWTLIISFSEHYL